MSRKLILDLANMNDFDFFYNIKKQSENIYWTGFNSPPNVDGLFKWFYSIIEKQTKSENRKIYIIKLLCDDLVEKCGYMYLDYINNNQCNASIAVSNKFMNFGIGTKAINEFCIIARKMGFKEVIAEIREDNFKSQKIFSNNGFINIKESKKKKLENQLQKINMFKYKFIL
ncbi:MAG: GNAT family N-acetyltransferase [Streptococcaceae bacterium]|jgi:RimJ/RimL family protein N-acetyltransferase|nr:GNAT family N-acetyltransferase [Streptococcaceae bacterium]